MAILSEIDPRVYTKMPYPECPNLRVRYLGTAGFVFEANDHTIVVDPYVSRPSTWDTATKPLQPDASRIQSYIPRADTVLVGHSLHDHVLDATELCLQTGATLLGSASTANVARSAGVPESQIKIVSAHQPISCGPHIVRALPSVHGKVFMGRVLFPGHIKKVPQWPMRIWNFRHGEVLNWHLTMNGVSVVHIDSADFIEDHLKDAQADILCLCAAGRQYRPDYVKDAIQLVRPKIVIPCHWDVFTTPIEEPPRLLPGIDLDGMISEVRHHGCTPVVLPFLGEFAYSTQPILD